MDRESTTETKPGIKLDHICRTLDIDSVSRSIKLQTALAQINAEQTSPSVLDQVGEIAPYIHALLADSFALARPEAYRHYLLRAFQLLNNLALEHHGLRMRFDKLLTQYVAARLGEEKIYSIHGDPNLRHVGEGVDQKYSDVQIMCRALGLDFDRLWNGLIPTWAAKQALDEAKKRGMIGDHQYQVYSGLINRCAQGE